MKQAVMSDMNNNPLYRKMRERFSVNGATIGEIMLMRAEKGNRASGVDAPVSAPAVKQAPVARVAPVKETPVRNKTASSIPHFVKSHNVLFSCLALVLCAVLLLAIMVPFFANSPFIGASANAQAPDVAPLAGVQSGAEVAPEVEQETSGFVNVMDAFQSSFSN